jgi:hypothetical protein
VLVVVLLNEWLRTGPRLRPVRRDERLGWRRMRRAARMLRTAVIMMLILVLGDGQAWRCQRKHCGKGEDRYLFAEHWRSFSSVRDDSRAGWKVSKSPRRCIPQP